MDFQFSRILKITLMILSDAFGFSLEKNVKKTINRGNNRLLAVHPLLSQMILFGIFTLVLPTTPSWAAVPNPPSNLIATAVGATKIQLTWTDNSSDEQGFSIERKTGTGSFLWIANVGVGVTTYENTGLSQNTQYFYQIKAYNGSNYSTYSNEANATTFTLNAPSNLSVSAVSYTQITLTWTDNSSEETGFKIERKTGETDTYSQVGTTGANTTTFTNNGLSQGTVYFYRVQAVSGTNNSAYSNEAKATTKTLSAPSDLKAAPLSTTQIKLKWTDNTSDETRFYIEYRIGAEGDYSQLSSVAANITTYTHNNLTANKTYYYRVRTYNGLSYSSYSNEAYATTPSCVEEGYYQP